MPPWIRSGLTVALNAMRVPSGDQENDPTLKSLPFVRWRAGSGRLHRLGDVERPEVREVVLLAHHLEVAEVVLALLGGFAVGSVAVNAMRLPSCDHAKPLTPFSAFVSCSAFAAVRVEREDLVLVADPAAGEREPSPSGDHCGLPADFSPRVSCSERPVCVLASQTCVTKAFCLKSVDVTVYATHFPSGEICAPPALWRLSRSSTVGTWRSAAIARGTETTTSSKARDCLNTRRHQCYIAPDVEVQREVQDASRAVRDGIIAAIWSAADVGTLMSKGNGGVSAGPLESCKQQRGHHSRRDERAALAEADLAPSVRRLAC